MQVLSYPGANGADGALLTLLVGSHGQSVSLPLFPSSSLHLSYPSHLCLSEGVLSRNKDTVPTLAVSRGDQSCPQVIRGIRDIWGQADQCSCLLKNVALYLV